jgi:hypothetical protein
VWDLPWAISRISISISSQLHSSNPRTQELHSILYTKCSTRSAPIRRHVFQTKRAGEAFVPGLVRSPTCVPQQRSKHALELWYAAVSGTYSTVPPHVQGVITEGKQDVQQRFKHRGKKRKPVV